MIAHNFFVSDPEEENAGKSFPECNKENLDSSNNGVSLDLLPEFISSKRSMVTRSMAKMLDESQESTSPNFASGRKRSRSDMVSMKARTGVFKLNPLYEASATSPQQKIKVSICSPKTKEKEMVSAILELARYGEEQFPAKKSRKITEQLLSKLTVRHKKRSGRSKLQKKRNRRTCVERMGTIP
jgi:hypothetical protein